MRKKTSLTILCGCFFAASLNVTGPNLFSPVVASPAPPETTAAPELFTCQDPSGNLITAPLVDDSAKRKIIHPIAPTLAASVNPSLTRAATIAQERANAHSKSMCWRYVKEALLAAGAVDSYPKTALAKQAGDELVNDYGFRQLPVTDPYAAPVGAVLVYTAEGAPGHVEIRTKTGFVSDFKTDKASKRKLIGVYAKA
ncbi:MAG: hypothetical protein ACR2ID_12090 [Chthoniobacterales bacterium]